MHFQIKNRWSDEVQFECELDEETVGANYGALLGLTIKKAVNAHVDLTGSNFAHANLSRANLSRANLVGANFAYANLLGANLSDVDLSCSNFAHADLSFANLSCSNFAYANFAHANLAGANFADANLTDTHLMGANIAGADFGYAKWSNGITLHRPPILIGGLYYPVIILDHHMQIGCELHTLPEWEAFDNERIALMDGYWARRFWRAHREALLALAKGDGRGVSVEVEAA